MNIIHLVDGQPPQILAGIESLPEQGVVWLDYLRDESESVGWPARFTALTGVEVDSEHVQDSFSAAHPSFFDATSDYDLLIFEGLGPVDAPFPLQLRRAMFLMTDRVLVTVRSSDALAFGRLHERIASGRLRCRASTVNLTHTILDAMVDRVLMVREPLDRLATEVQEQLLDGPSQDMHWTALLNYRRAARRLELLAENQLEALDAWRSGSHQSWIEADTIRVRDLSDHVKRVLEHASNIERDIEAAVQLHYARMSHRTNQVMQTLTVLSAVFFPLTLIVGIYGMNFDHMPELRWRWGYFMVLGLLAAIALAMLLWFKRRRYF